MALHGISHTKIPHPPRESQPYLDKTDLHQMLSWLSRRFRFLNPDQFLNGEKDGVLLTFDDGFANNFTNVLPLLEEFNAPAVFFISTQHVSEPGNWLPATMKMAQLGWGHEKDIPREIAIDCYNGMSEEQLRVAARNPLVTVGSHSVSHPFLSQVPTSQLKFELESSRKYLQKISSQAVDLFAYPTGDYNRVVAEAVRDYGYRSAFAMDPLSVGLLGFEIPRVGIYEPHSYYLSLKLSGLHRRPFNCSSIPGSTNYDK